MKKLTLPSILSLVVAAIVVILFAPICRFDLLTYDDNRNIYQNPHYQIVNPGSKSLTVEFLPFWKRGYYELYTPITYTIWGICAIFSHAATVRIMPDGGANGFDAALFHTVGLAFHVANALLVFALLRRLLPNTATNRGGDTAALIGALVFAVHPLQVEAVAWATGNNNCFCAFFVLLSLWMFLDFAHPKSDKHSISWSWYIFATVFYILALLTKPTGVVVPLLAALLCFIPVDNAQRIRPNIIGMGLLFWCGLAVACIVVTSAASSGGVVPTALWVRPFLAGDALAFYIGKVVFPYPLCVDYGHGQSVVWSSWWGYLTWSVPVGLFALLFRVSGDLGRRLRVAFLLFVAGVLPVLGFVPYYYHPISTVADRYLYLSLFGVAYAVASILCWEKTGEYRRIVLPIIGIVLILLMWRTSVYLPVWKNTFVFASHTLRVNPKSWRAQSDLGNCLMQQNRMAAALNAYRSAYRLKPEDPPIVLNLGIGLLRNERFGEAEVVFRKLLVDQPQSASVRCGLSSALTGLKRHTEAIAIAKQATEIKPDYWQAQSQLGIAYMQSGDMPKAAESFRRALSMAPSEPRLQTLLAQCQGGKPH